MTLPDSISADERIIRATRFRSRTEPQGLDVTHTHGELAASLACPRPVGPGGKDSLPLISWATFRGARRALANVTEVHALGLDVDTPTADPAGLVARVRHALGGVEVYAHSTASSAADAYRLRLIVPYDAPATADEHRASWALVARLLERDGVNVDRACSDAARGFYVWALPASGAYWHAHIEGAPWPASQAARAEEQRRATEARRRPAPQRHAPVTRASTSGWGAIERARRYLAHVEPAISGQEGHRATYIAAAKVLSLGLGEEEAFELLANEWNPRCVPPWSERDLRRKVREAAKARTARAVGVVA